MILPIIVILLVLTWLLTYVSTSIVEKLSLRKGLVAEDAHKLNRTNIPKIGGLGFSIGLLTSIIMISAILGTASNHYQLTPFLLFASVIAVSTLIGLVDDMKKLGGKTKVLLTLTPGLIVLLSGSYSPKVFIPFIGFVNAHIVYPLLIPVIFAVSMNAINMTDTQNGLAPMVSLVLLTTMFAGTLMTMPLDTPIETGTLTLLYAITLTSLVAYLPFNIYPSRVFNGDTGSLTWGAVIAFFAVSSKIEALLVLAAMPVITNGFTILSSIKGFIEHSQLKQRPVKVDKAKNLIMVNPSEKAPLTLVSITVAPRALREDELVCTLVLLVVLSSAFSLIVWSLVW